MGHADLKTTARYTHYRARGGEARRLAEAFAVGEPVEAEEAVDAVVPRDACKRSASVRLPHERKRVPPERRSQ